MPPYQIQNGVVDLPAGGITAVGSGLTINSGTIAATNAIIQYSTTLSTAQLLGINNTPVTIAAAPGFGFAYDVTETLYEIVPGTTAFTATGTLGLYYAVPGPVATKGADNAPATAAFLASSTAETVCSTINASIQSAGSVANQPLVLGNNAGSLTVGNGSLVFNCAYVKARV